MVNGYAGEQKTRAKLSNSFWIITRSVDVDGVDLIVEVMARSDEELESQRLNTPKLGYVQAKFFEGRNQVKIHRKYVEHSGAAVPRRGFFAFLHTTDGEREDENYFFNSQQIIDNWHLDQSGEHYCFSLTNKRDYDEFKNLKIVKLEALIKDGIQDLTSSIEHLVQQHFIGVNCEVRVSGDIAGTYILGHFEDVPVVIYESKDKVKQPLHARIDLFPYSGYYRWGHTGTACHFLATSILSHFFFGQAPSRSEVSRMVTYLLQDINEDENHRITTQQIIHALACIPSHVLHTDASLDKVFSALYEETCAQYKNYLQSI